MEDSKARQNKSSVKRKKQKQKNLLIAYASLLGVAVLSAVIFFFVTGGKKQLIFPASAVTIDGIVSDVYNGKITASAVAESLPDAPIDATLPAPEAEPDAGAGDTVPVEDQTATADTANSETAVPDETGATDGINPEEATEPVSEDSYSDVVAKVSEALTQGDTQVIKEKVIYKDDFGGYGFYGDTQIKAFVDYMVNNSDKKDEFIEAISKEATYSAQKDSKMVVALPSIYYVFTTNKDNTLTSVETFGDATINGGDTKEVGPVLPMPYRISAKNADSTKKGVDQDVEATLNDRKIAINVNFNKK